MLVVEDWAEIRRLRRSEGVSISEIARVMGCSRNTVKAALASEGPPRYERARSRLLVDEYEPGIRELLSAFPRMPATVIAERVGWPYSIRTLSGRVAELRPGYLPPDPASRTASVAGEIFRRNFAASRGPTGEVFQFDVEDRPLKTVHPEIAAHDVMIVASVGAMHANVPRLREDRFVLGNKRAAFAAAP